MGGRGASYRMKFSDRAKDLFLYGKAEYSSNKYFRFQHYQDKDNIVVVTNNITLIKNSPALIVNNNEAIFLKNWQVEPVMNYNNGIYAFAVKLNRKYFKKYTFRSDFEEVYFKKADTFDSLAKVAKEQDKANMPIAQGWGKRHVQWRIDWRN